MAVKFTPKLKPFGHQVEGFKALCRHPVFALFDEPGAGKTKQVVDAAQAMYQAGAVDLVVVACPAQVAGVWTDREVGEVKKHMVQDYTMLRYDRDGELKLEFLEFEGDLVWVVASLEFLRQEDAQGGFPKAEQLAEFMARRKSWLVVDEATAVGEWSSLQTKAVLRLRKDARRVTLLDGTPSGNSPMTLYSKFKVMDPDILGCKNFFHFRARYAKLGGWKGKAVVGYKNIDRLSAITAPYCLRREKRDFIDLPERMPPQFQVVELSQKTWDTYRQMRDELVAEIEGRQVAVQYVHLKVLRLAQICSGFLGGFQNDVTLEKEVKELSCETTDSLLSLLSSRFQEREDFKCVVWCRWRAELLRLISRLSKAFPKVPVPYAYGGSQQDLKLVHPDSSYQGPAIVVAQPQAAQYGLNFAKASTNIWLSYDYNLVTRQQAGERVMRQGQKERVLDVDFLVRGPQGQKTVTFDIRKSLQDKEEVAKRTVSQWRSALADE